MAELLICDDIIDEIARQIPMTFDEKRAIKESIWALAVATKPGNGEYAGYLRHRVEEGELTTVVSIVFQIGIWKSNKAAASETVMEWFLNVWLKGKD